jgi:hypothetical protein
MMDFICGILLGLMCLGSGVCCIPPLLQSIEQKHKPTIWFSIACMMGMIALAIALVWKAIMGVI